METDVPPNEAICRVTLAEASGKKENFKKRKKGGAGETTKWDNKKKIGTNPIRRNINRRDSPLPSTRSLKQLGFPEKNGLAMSEEEESGSGHYRVQ